MISNINIINIIIIFLITTVVGSLTYRSRLIVARDRLNVTPWLPSNADSDESTTSSAMFQRDWSAVNIDNEQLDESATWLVATMLPWSVCITILLRACKPVCNHIARLKSN